MLRRGLGLLAAILVASAPFAEAAQRHGTDRNCSDFSTWAEAQAFFQSAGGGDPYGLDRDHDGIACESLPGSPSSGTTPTRVPTRTPTPKPTETVASDSVAVPTATRTPAATRTPRGRTVTPTTTAAPGEMREEAAPREMPTTPPSTPGLEPVAQVTPSPAEIRLVGAPPSPLPLASPRVEPPGACAQPAPLGCPLPVGVAVRAAIVNAEGVHRWRLAAPGGQPMAVQITDLDGRLAVEIYGPDELLRTAARSDDAAELALRVDDVAPGAYLIVIASEEGGARYRLVATIEPDEE